MEILELVLKQIASLLLMFMLYWGIESAINAICDK